MPSLRRPREPGPGECCGNGCSRCVWDVYYDKLAEYEAQVSSESINEESSDDETSEESLSGDDNYIGSVVVRYIKPPEESSDATLVHDKRETNIIRELDSSYLPISEVKIIKISGDPTDVLNRGVCLLDLVTSVPTPFTPAIPGDVVDIFVPNSGMVQGCEKSDGGSNNLLFSCPSRYQGDPVNEICALLHLDPEQWCELHRSPFVPENNFPPWLPLRKPLTIRILLTLFVDLSTNSFLHPCFFESLLRLYENNTPGSSESASLTHTPRTTTPVLSTAQALKICASPEHSIEVVRQLQHSSRLFPRISDFLRIFSFIHVPLDRFLEISCPLRPRKFSVVKECIEDIFPSGKSENAIEEKKNVITRLCMRQTVLCPKVDGYRRHSCFSSNSDHCEPRECISVCQNKANFNCLSPVASSTLKASTNTFSSSDIITEVVKYFEERLKTVSMERKPNEKDSCANTSAEKTDVAYTLGHVSGSLLRKGYLTSHLPLPEQPCVLSSSYPFAPSANIYLGRSSFSSTRFSNALSTAVESIRRLSFSSSVAGGKFLPFVAGAHRVYLIGMGTGMAPLMSAVYFLQQNLPPSFNSLHTIDSRCTEECCPCSSAMPKGLGAPTLPEHPTSSANLFFFPCHVLYGARSKQELIFHDDLCTALQERSIASYVFALSRERCINSLDIVSEKQRKKGSEFNEKVIEEEQEKCSSPKKRGGSLSFSTPFQHITDILESSDEKKKELKAGLLKGTTSVFACGPPHALQGLREWFIRRLFCSANVQKDDLKDTVAEIEEEKGICDIWNSLEENNQIVFDTWNSWR